MPLVIKRMGPARAALTAGVLTTALTITFIAALVSLTQTQTARAIRSALAGPDNLAVTLSSSLSAQQRPQARAAISGDLRRAFGTVPFTLFGSLRVDGLALRGNVPAKPAGAGRTRQIATVVAADALAAHATLISGRWPADAAAGGAAGQPVPVALSARAAARLGVSVGKVLTLRSPYDRQDVVLRVSGLFRPDDPAGPYWHLDPLNGKGIGQAGGFTTYGPLFASASMMRAGPLSAQLADWVAIPRSSASIAATGLQPLSTRMNSALSALTASNAAGNPVATSPLPGLLSRLSAAVLISRALLLIGLLELLVMSAATLTLMARALAGERRAETALMRARGGAERQLVRLGAAESTLIVAPAVIIGPVAGIWLAGRLAAGRVHLANAAGPAGGHGFPASIWLLALVIAAGKTTLLNIIGGLDRPDSGTVVIGGTEVTSLNSDELARLRRETLAFVFQSYALMPILTAAENVAVPMRLTRTDPAQRDERAMLLLRMVGLGEHAHQRAYELSGGQQQRVAIARALANRPRLLIADEPTGQLDSQNARQIMRLLRVLSEGEGVTVLVATHDKAVLAIADRQLRISDGLVSETAPAASGA
jgi:putative ABC transport system ATP-binding protein